MSSLPPHTMLNMPALSPTMEQGSLATWHVKEGDEVAAGDVLADIETDKAVLGFENQEEGFVAKLLVKGGAKDIPVGTPVAILVENVEDVTKFETYEPEAASPSAQSQPAVDSAPQPPKVVPPTPRASSIQDFQGMKIGPAAKKLILEHGLSASVIPSTGPRGMVTKGDVLLAVSKGAGKVAEPATPAPRKEAPPRQTVTETSKQGKETHVEGVPFMDTPTTQVRRIIASRLLESKTTIPALYVSADADVDAVSLMRASLKRQGTRVSVNDFVVKAVALALKDVPRANAFWDQAREDAVHSSGVDVSIAVATDSGLLTPIIRDADKKGLLEISAEARQLAQRARENKLKPEEFQGGSFTISNLGMFGIDEFSAIINPPQGCIMAVGGSQQEVFLEGGEPRVKDRMRVTISADHRVFDGDVASQFLNTFCSYFNNPVKLIV
ncbi:unnamed protein product [Ostreobium quekettii]|uniref:Dihydrolipoamide acetyltransferase component of pyruvate dehydrogenase complex n=1 Tax=Ostreobium quekettii TaxID=121088 RepID=A0A8S1J8H5_9CHLO|nr:unnamed protein product [Ostreobium quekettii]